MPWYDIVGSIFVIVIVLLIIAFTGWVVADSAKRRIGRNRQWKIDDQLYAEQHELTQQAETIKTIEAEIYKTPLEKLIDQAEADEAERFRKANEHLEPAPAPDVSSYKMETINEGVTKEHGRTYLIGSDGYPVDVTPIDQGGCKCWQCRGWMTR